MKYLVCFFLLFTQFLAFSQYFDTIPAMESSSIKHLRIDMDAMTFFHNEEFLNPYTEGATWIGYQFQPRLVYKLNKNTEGSVGVHLLQNAGREAFTQVIPLFRIRHQFTEEFSLIMGNIFGASFHRLDESIFSYERSFNDNVEYGLQFLYKNDRLDMDLWLDWEQFIEREDPFQEVFSLGYRGDYQWLKKDGFSSSIGTQLLVRHHGGQIDASEERVSTIANVGLNLSLDYELSQKRKIQLKGEYFFYKAIDNPEESIHHQIYEDGSAFKLELSYRSQKWKTQFGYFQGYQYIAPKGENLYQSVSDYRLYSEQDRNIVFGKVFYTIPYDEDFQFSFMTGIYYDKSSSSADYNYGINMKINTQFILKNWKE